jgi:putative DNA-invertase from lambdoid prophage Rac
MFASGLYARVSTHDQQTLTLQVRAMREHATGRGWTIAVQTKEIGSRASEREQREKLFAAARRRDSDFPEHRWTPPRSKNFAQLE